MWNYIIPAAISGITALMSRRGGGGQPTGGGGIPGLSPGLEQQLMAMLTQGQARNARTEPVHDAAMRMAMGMAPSWARGGGPGNPRMAQARTAAQTPRPRQQTNPDVAKALQMLMARLGPVG